MLVMLIMDETYNLRFARDNSFLLLFDYRVLNSLSANLTVFDNQLVRSFGFRNGSLAVHLNINDGTLSYSEYQFSTSVTLSNHDNRKYA